MNWNVLLLVLVCFGLFLWGIYPLIAYIHETLVPPKIELSEEDDEIKIGRLLILKRQGSIDENFFKRELDKKFTLSEIKLHIRAAERSFHLVYVFIGVGIFLTIVSHLSIIDTMFPISILEIENEKIYMKMIIAGLGRFSLWFLALFFVLFSVIHLIWNEFCLYSYKKIIDKEIKEQTR